MQLHAGEYLIEQASRILPVLCTMAVDAVALSPHMPNADTGVYLHRQQSTQQLNTTASLAQLASHSAMMTWSTSSCAIWYVLQLAATTMLSISSGCRLIQHILHSPAAFSCL